MQIINLSPLQFFIQRTFYRNSKEKKRIYKIGKYSTFSYDEEMDYKRLSTNEESIMDQFEDSDEESIDLYEELKDIRDEMIGT